jgi:ATP phosphoribosyltransferase regulatory subunit
MALQPAAGARDLNPGQVESNRLLCERLAEVYRLWGYREVAPPTIERLDTLEAGGGIDGREVLRLASDEPLGLRPELTASIARAASTRLASRPRPLRLWACGSTFRTVAADGGGQRLQEELQSGVELLGVASPAADGELMHLVLAAMASLGLRAEHRPTLLVGHHGLLDALLAQVPAVQREPARNALTEFDPLALSLLPVPPGIRERLESLLNLRGEPSKVMAHLQQWIGPLPLLDSLANSLAAVAPAAQALGVRLQLDPTFQPHFDLYDGLVLKLVCQGPDAPVAIASGGRYDALVGRFCTKATEAFGTGFGFAIEAIRELLGPACPASERPAPWLVASPRNDDLEPLLTQLAALHGRGEAAELCSVACATQAEADQLAAERGCRGALWLPA